MATDNVSQIPQPHLLVLDESTGEQLVIPVFTLRNIANGSTIPDNELTKAIALALLGMIEDE